MSNCFRAELTLENARLALSSIHGRERVSDVIRDERLAACAKCDLKCTDEDGDFCGAGCGCGLGGSKPLVLRVAASLGWDADMTLYTEKNGGLCKHPKRHLGQGWGKMRA